MPRTERWVPSHPNEASANLLAGGGSYLQFVRNASSAKGNRARCACVSSLTHLVLPPGPASTGSEPPHGPAPRADRAAALTGGQGEGKERPLADSPRGRGIGAPGEGSGCRCAGGAGGPKLLPHTTHTAAGEDAGSRPVKESRRAASGQARPWPAWRPSWTGGGEAPGEQCRTGRSRVGPARGGCYVATCWVLGGRRPLGPKGLGGWGGIHVDRALSMGPTL